MAKRMIIMANKQKSLFHTKWMCKYHIVIKEKQYIIDTIQI